MSLTGWDLDTCLGKLHRFWWWCVDYAEDGDLRRHNDDRLGLAVGVLPGEESRRFVEAMVAARWLDRDPYFRVHDWWNYIGKFLQSKYKRDPAKWQSVKDLYCTGTVTGTAPPNLTNPTKPNQPNLSLPFDETGFHSFWIEWPKKRGEKAAREVWDKIRPDVELCQRVVDAVKRQKSSAQWLRNDGQYIPEAARWLKAERWNDEITQSGQFLSLNDIRRRHKERKQSG